jgi:hypothetical protein
MAMACSTETASTRTHISLAMHASPVFFLRPSDLFSPLLWRGLLLLRLLLLLLHLHPRWIDPSIAIILLLSHACCITITIFSNHHIHHGQTPPRALVTSYHDKALGWMDLRPPPT